MIRRKEFQLKARGKTLGLGVVTRVMGIINVTPDSFSGDGNLNSKERGRKALGRALKMISSGADIIDVGGESTRPMAGNVSALEECRRVIPVIEALVAKGSSALISVDTSKSVVAGEALRAGADMVNVVRGHALSRGLLQVIKQHQAALILMHMRGTPRTMQSLTRYSDLIADVLGELRGSIKTAIGSGINEQSLVIDPGIGFAKTAEQNFLILRELSAFAESGFPLLVGPSRKSFIGKVLEAGPADRLIGTVAAVTAAVLEGAHIVRVHDVPQIIEAVRVADAVLQGGK